MPPAKTAPGAEEWEVSKQGHPNYIGSAWIENGSTERPALAMSLTHAAAIVREHNAAPGLLAALEGLVNAKPDRCEKCRRACVVTINDIETTCVWHDAIQAIARARGQA